MCCPNVLCNFCDLFQLGVRMLVADPIWGWGVQVCVGFLYATNLPAQRLPNWTQEDFDKHNWGEHGDGYTDFPLVGRDQNEAMDMLFAGTMMYPMVGPMFPPASLRVA